jgi:DNA-binding GntR family transcriptional regulator
MPKISQPKSKRSSQNSSEPLRQTAYQKTKELIITIKLAPGEQIDESRLAQKLSIGRTPTREALFRLAAENLVEVVYGRGFFVKDVTLHHIRDLFEAMLILEKSAVALAARRIQKAHLKTLQGVNDELQVAWQGRNFLQVTLLNSQFHRTIYEAMDNSLLYSCLDRLQNQSQRLAYICFSKESPVFDLQSHGELAIQDHRGLIEALARGDEEPAVKLISEHIRLFQRRVQHFTLPSLEHEE